ncbi:BMC domain-containing protein [Parageobacillus thermoglucosidasius]|uniref:BMC domain-containing protein n=1 Tax=Parageobacillus thermoglucosidasius TaxID=1426 RepID=UPI000B57EFC5|nr:BMC domain-containing protein [Parageobacillus thermoglucosidasius]MBY6269227.1 microcompartment protein [Parageobacillus thermoglucosidasius]OUM85084.1 MAG: microcompartment protein [Parageobacillus thermoglucosidasius]
MGINAIGIIETYGMVSAIEAADVAVKSANVSLLGYELTKGSGMVTIKLEGDVAAVRAAVEAAWEAAKRVGNVYSKHIIARPHDELEKIIHSKETVGPINDGKKEKTEEMPLQTNQNEEGASESNKREETHSDEAMREIAELKEKDEGKHEQPETHLRKEKPSLLEEPKELDQKTHPSTPENRKIFEEQGNEKQPNDKEVCNLCHDPKCPRKKGDLKSACIHYQEIRRKDSK